MSGIAGLFYLNQRPVDPAELTRMTDILAHRGPDNSATWQADHVGLAHRMLWTTPESLTEQLPFYEADRRLAITADARLDNRVELCARLGLPDDLSDSRLILEAYAAWGERCVEHLLGAFAFVIWDTAHQQLFCARDHFGVKPFYYSHQPHRLFIFGSEIKALTTHSEVSTALNELMVGYYLTSRLESKTLTMYEGIFRLPPAHAMLITADRIRAYPYWFLDPYAQLPPQSDDEYAAQFRELLTEAVRCRLRRYSPCGTTLSGGLDSSSVSCIARTLIPADELFSSISLVPENDPLCDERPFINEILAGGGYQPHYITIDHLNPLVDWQKVLWHYDEPIIGPNLYLNWHMAHMAQQQNLRVMFDGADGDSTVSHGFGYLTELAYRGDWPAVAKEINALTQHGYGDAPTLFAKYAVEPLQQMTAQGQWFSFAETVRQIETHVGLPSRELWLQYGVKPRTPHKVRQGWRTVRRRPQLSTPHAEMINDAFLTKLELSIEKPTPSPTLTLQYDHWRTLNSPLMPYILELTDKTAAAFSVEYRHPFMDKRLIEFCVALPPTLKLQSGWPRRILRRALQGILPDKIRLRHRKGNYQENLIRTMRTFARPLIEQTLSEQGEAIAPYVDMVAVQAAYQRLMHEPQVASKDMMTVWKATHLALWLTRD